MAAAKTTTNHQEIKRWVESKGGHPARVKTTGRKGDPGILRIDFPGFSGEDTLVEMSWDDWFEAFDKNKLAFIYQPRTRFSKLVSRTTAKTSSKKTSSRAAAKRTTPRRGTGAKRSTKRSSVAKTRAKRSTSRSSR